MGGYKLAVVQMDSQADLQHNFKTAERWVGEAARRGASLVSLPETFNMIAGGEAAGSAETIPGPTSEFLAGLAARHRLWLHGGSFREISDSGKAFNTTLMFTPEGKLAAQYRKLHLFDIDIAGGPNYRESENTSPGPAMVTAQTELGCLGFAICYDLRFPELFTLMALAGTELIFLPANFTQTTGQAHWKILLRARAIENGCYIVAAAQCGLKPAYQAHGHSVIINPRGEIIAELPEGEGIVMAEIDLNTVAATRAQMPNLKNRRSDIYRLEKL